MALAKGKLPETGSQPSFQDPVNPADGLDSSDAGLRRQAARQLAAVPGSEEVMLARIEVESDPAVREALFLSVMQRGTAQAARGLAELIRSEDAALRNAAIETLAALPTEVEPLMDMLLSDADPDVRILACNLLQMLPHPRVADWLTLVVSEDDHPNVCAAAVDGLAEVGSAECLPTLDALAARFPDDAFLQFAIDTVRARLDTR